MGDLHSRLPYRGRRLLDFGYSMYEEKELADKRGQDEFAKLVGIVPDDLDMAKIVAVRPMGKDQRRGQIWVLAIWLSIRKN